MANIGKSIVIKGDLTGDEDLIVEGKVEGRIHLPNHKVTIGQGGTVEAEVHAKQIVVIGRIAGNVSAGERLEIQASGIVHGDVRAPRLVVQEGAALNGSIEMSVKEAPAQSRPTTAPSPASTSSGSAVPIGQAAGAGGERRTG
jgi:cytoskeletal protein CcmA (bactofilin family)